MAKLNSMAPVLPVRDVLSALENYALLGFRAKPYQRAEVVAGMGKACEAHEMTLIGGETADMPDMYEPGDFDVAGFIVGGLGLAQEGLLLISNDAEVERLLSLAAAGWVSHFACAFKAAVRPEQLARLSGDAQFASFVRNNDLYVVGADLRLAAVRSRSFPPGCRPPAASRPPARRR